MRSPAQELATRLGDWHAGSRNLYEALANRIETLVRDGQLAPETRLPAERRLAAALNVSRGTVMAAYEQLRERGFVETRHGSGTVVLADRSPVTSAREAQLATAMPETIFRQLLALDDDAIDMRGAYWFDHGLPEAALERAHKQLHAIGNTHGYLVAGLPRLRALIAEHLTTSGLATSPEQVLVTSGAQQAIALVAQVVLGAGDVAVMEDPTFPGAMEAAVAQQARIVTVPTSATGVDLPRLKATIERVRPRLVYLIPSVHNPAGTVMPSLARQRLAEMLSAHEVVVLDDRTLADTQIGEGSRPAPLAAYADEDAAARIVTVGSLSKLIWGGLRVGWVRASDRFLAPLARFKTIVDLGTSVPSQLVASELLEHHLDDIVRARHADIPERLELMGAELSRQLPEWRYQQPQGGLCLWIDLGGHDAVEFSHLAARHGVSVLPGRVASPSGGFGGHLRVAYGQAPEVLSEGVARLARAWDDHRERLLCRQRNNVSVLV